MASRKNVQNTHISAEIRQLHGAILDIVAVINQPQRDDALLKEAGVALDRALFPLLVLIERLGPIGVVDLADRVGRDHSTVSRQVAKLEELGLVERREGRADRRVREAMPTRKGRAIAEALDAARERMAATIFATWSERDFSDLVRLVRRFADDLSALA
jgi:DNA-binding MarR family transcriptional regulator